MEYLWGGNVSFARSTDSRVSTILLLELHQPNRIDSSCYIWTIPNSNFRRRKSSIRGIKSSSNALIKNSRTGYGWSFFVRKNILLNEIRKGKRCDFCPVKKMEEIWIFSWRGSHCHCVLFVDGGIMQCYNFLGEGIIEMVLSPQGLC